MDLLGWLKPKSRTIKASDGRPTNLTAPYSGARITRLNDHWMPNHYSGDQAIRESWNLLTARIRDRVRNDNVLTKCKATLSRLVIGTSVQTFSEASDGAEEGELEQLVEFETESDRWFSRWAEMEAHSEGEHSLWHLHRQSFEDTIEAGNSLWLKVLDETPGRMIPLCYQLLEWEQVDMTMDRDREPSRNLKGVVWNRISNGIEYDQNNRKIAFHLYDAHPYDSTAGWTTASERVPAERIMHFYCPSRPSARVGVTWFAPQLQTSMDLDRYIANELTTRALLALMGVAVKSNDVKGSTGLEAEDSQTGILNWKLGYPHVGYLKKDDEVEVVESKRDTKEAAALINLLLNLQAMGCRISLQRLLGDATRANLASIKAAAADDEAMVAPLQEEFAQRIARPIRREHIRWCLARGVFNSLTAREYRRDIARYEQMSVISGQKNEKDVDDGIAAIDRLRAGLSTYPDECARHNKHWRRNLSLMAKVNQAAAAAGVVLDWTKGQGAAPMGATSDANAMREAQETEQTPDDGDQ